MTPFSTYRLRVGERHRAYVLARLDIAIGDGLRRITKVAELDMLVQRARLLAFASPELGVLVIDVVDDSDRVAPAETARAMLGRGFARRLDQFHRLAIEKRGGLFKGASCDEMGEDACFSGPRVTHPSSR
jgi:hypothetical protein